MECHQVDYGNMKSPLSYQISEYDCGQATLLNAIRFIYKRGEISPVLLKYITQYTLDTINDEGQIGRHGTSPYALEYLAKWINSTNHISLKAKILNGENVSINNVDLLNCICSNGGVAILRVWSDCEHYVLCTGVKEKYVHIFDPYYLEDGAYDDDTEVIMINNKPFEYNRIVSKKRIEELSKNDYALVRNDESMILLLYK